MTIFKYWGKTRLLQRAGGDDYHLLCWHSLDVAAVGYEMAINNIYHLKDYLRELGFSCPIKGAQFFAWLLCWHDIGKFAHAFQQQYCHEDFGTQNAACKKYVPLHHTSLGQWLWDHVLCDQTALLPSANIPAYQLQQIISRWMSVSLGHHGKPADAPEHCNHFRPQDRAAASDFLKRCKALFPELTIPDAWCEEAYRQRFKSLSWLLSAIAVLADWIGSDTHYFPRIAASGSFTDYWAQARVQACAALRTLPPQNPVAPFNGIAALFPFIREPTPLQRMALEMDVSAPGPQLFILEDVTGAGKTEAALILAHRLMAAGKAQGLFLGLPTMATANAMYARMHDTWTAFYQPGTRPSLVLAHSARHLSDRFSQSVWFAEPTDSADPDEPQSFAQGCAAWFADSNKKALLADVGVGTLDQAMMAVMAFKHHNLRLLGLQGKVLIADEIHACDAYMNMIVENLLEMQARFGNSVILLSATLSHLQRSKLTAAFARGAGINEGSPRPAITDYPWITHATSQGIHSHHVETRPQVARSVAVDWLHSEQACIETIRQAAKKGDCITWIRNSVDDAIATYRQLIDNQVVPAQNILLFHSRFAFCDRQRIENQTLAWFGKVGSEPRTGKVIISTQVLEQSLDIDFDQMISDLAPVDLLIQRAGRLQRHIRDRNGQLKTSGADEREPPALMIFAPEWNDDPPANWVSVAMRNSAYVYPEHGRLWLTQRILRQQGEIRMPQSARLLIEAVYGEGVELPDGLKQTAAEQEGKYFCDRAFAAQGLVNFAPGYLSNTSNYLPDKLSTRLAEESVTLWLARWVNGEITPYAQCDHPWEMSSLRVRLSWWQKHQHDFTLLDGVALQDWLTQQRQSHALVIMLPDGEAGGYSAEMGLTGNRC